MPADPAPDVDAYLASLPEDRRQALSALRALIRDTLPGASEAIRYRMPVYTLPGREEPVVAIASQKQYISLYLDPARLAAHLDEFAGLNLGKSCVRFRHLAQLPLESVRAILRESATPPA